MMACRLIPIRTPYTFVLDDALWIAWSGPRERMRGMGAPSAQLGVQGFGRLSLIAVAAATTRRRAPRCLQLSANLLDRITFQIDHDQRWFL
jgi:hypothetical protein